MTCEEQLEEALKKLVVITEFYCGMHGSCLFAKEEIYNVKKLLKTLKEERALKEKEMTREEQLEQVIRDLIWNISTDYIRFGREPSDGILDCVAQANYVLSTQRDNGASLWRCIKTEPPQGGGAVIARFEDKHGRVFSSILSTMEINRGMHRGYTHYMYFPPLNPWETEETEEPEPEPNETFRPDRVRSAPRLIDAALRTDDGGAE